VPRSTYLFFCLATVSLFVCLFFSLSISECKASKMASLSLPFLCFCVRVCVLFLCVKLLQYQNSNTGESVADAPLHEKEEEGDSTMSIITEDVLLCGLVRPAGGWPCPPATTALHNWCVSAHHSKRGEDGAGSCGPQKSPFSLTSCVK
jgi:hypothetical protein